MIRGGNLTLSYNDGSASGSRTTGGDGYAYITLDGTEPAPGTSMTATGSATYYKTKTVTWSYGLYGVCDNLIFMEVIDCYACYSGPNTGPDGQPIDKSRLPGDLGCRDPQPLTGTFAGSFGSACITNPKRTEVFDNQTPLYLLGYAPATGFVYTVNAQGQDITCRTPLTSIQVPVYVSFNNRNVFRLSFYSVQRCDPATPKDHCYYPVQGHPDQYNNNVACSVYHQGGTCSPALMKGSPSISGCVTDGGGNKTGGAYGFLAGEYSYTLDNCGCGGPVDVTPTGGEVTPISPTGGEVTPISPTGGEVTPISMMARSPHAAAIEDHWRRVKDVYRCPYRTAPSCGCEAVPGGCALGKYKGKPTFRDCLDCCKDEERDPL